MSWYGGVIARTADLQSRGHVFYCWLFLFT